MLIEMSTRLLEGASEHRELPRELCPHPYSLGTLACKQQSKSARTADSTRYQGRRVLPIGKLIQTNQQLVAIGAYHDRALLELCTSGKRSPDVHDIDIRAAFYIGEKPSRLVTKRMLVLG